MAHRKTAPSGAISASDASGVAAAGSSQLARDRVGGTGDHAGPTEEELGVGVEQTLCVLRAIPWLGAEFDDLAVGGA